MSVDFSERAAWPEQVNRDTLLDLLIENICPYYPKYILELVTNPEFDEYPSGTWRDCVDQEKWLHLSLEERFVQFLLAWQQAEIEVDSDDD